LIEGKLAVGLDILLGWEPAGGFIIMNLEGGVVQERKTIDHPPDPVPLLLFEGKINGLFKAQGLALIKRIITCVIVCDAFFSQTVIVLGTVFLSDDLNRLAPVFLPALMIKDEKFFESIEFGHLQVPVEFLQDIVNPRTHESLNSLCLNLNLLDIVKSILVGAGFISGELRMRIGWHPLPHLRFVEDYNYF